MLGVSVGVEEAHGHGLGPSTPHRFGETGELSRVEGSDFIAAGPEAAGHPDAVVPRDERRWPVTHEGVELGPVLSTDLDDVLEALVGDEHHTSAFSLQQRVRRHGRPVQQQECDTLGDHPADAVEDRLGRVVRGGWDLERFDRSVGEKHQVREGATRVHGQERR